MKQRSFQLRVALTAALISGAILLSVSAVAGWLIWRQFLVSVDARLLEPGGRIYSAVGGGNPDWRRADGELDRGLGQDPSLTSLVFVLNRESGASEFVSEGAEWLEAADLAGRQPTDEALAEAERKRPPPPRGRPTPEPKPPRGRPGRPPPPATPAFHTFEAPDGSDWRVMVVGGPHRTLFLAKPINAFSDELKPAIRTLLAIIPLGLFAVALGSWLLAKRAVRPLRRIGETASQITAAGLDARIPETGREFHEFQQLVQVFNGMMERLEVSFHQATRFSSDASHELQTPIAILQAEVDTALKKSDPGTDLESSLLQVASEVQRLKRITQSLLLLSRADAGHVRMKRDPFDLSREVDAICEDGELLCEDAQLTLRTDIEPNLQIAADRTLVAQALQNLMQNAVKYNRAGGEVVCKLSKTGDAARFEISNTGSGIPAEQREKIFDRFYRVDLSRSRKKDGFGLGLNLALEIANMHGGSLQLLEATGEKTAFRIEFPLASAS